MSKNWEQQRGMERWGEERVKQEPTNTGRERDRELWIKRDGEIEKEWMNNSCGKEEKLEWLWICAVELGSLVGQ